MSTGCPEVAVSFGASSILTHNFNHLWCEAYNRRASDGITHFAMLHSDIGPNTGWLATLLQELKATDSAMVSAVSPLKCFDGLTSTALDLGDKVRRLTLREVFTQLPETFSGQDTLRVFQNSRLLLNTGCFILDMAKVDPGSAFFTFHDSVAFRDGKWSCDFVPEDWLFSRMLIEHGLKLSATRKVRLEHFGPIGFHNQDGWGAKSTDERV